MASTLNLGSMRSGAGQRQTPLPTGGEIHDAAEDGRHVPGDHGDQDGDDREELPEQDM